MRTAAVDRSSSSSHMSHRPPVSFSSYCINTGMGLMHQSLDETRLASRRTSECYQHSTPLASGNIALHPSSIQSSTSSSPPYVHRRRLFNHTSQMTSYSALKRKAQRPDSSSNFSRFQVNLEHVWGFTSLSNSIISQDHSTLAYAAGSTVVLYDIQNRKQDFIMNTARKSITSLSLSADGRYLATGECGHDPKVRVWDLMGDKTVSIDLGDHKFAIDCVCFSPNVDRLVSIGSLHDGNIYVWNWKEKKKLASNKCTCSVRRIAFAEDGSYFVTVGNRHVKFWYLMSTASLEVVPLRGRYAILAERKDNFFTDVVCGRGDCAGMTYVITSTGLLCQFDEHRQMRAEQDLQEKTNCLAIGDLYLVVGCVKGAVYVFSPQTLDYLMSMPLPHYLGVDIAFITSIDQMTYSNQQNLAFPDTIAVCLDEDKSMLTCFYNDHSFYIWDIKNTRSIKKHDSHLFHSGCGWAIETYSRNSVSTTGSALAQLSCMTCSSDNSIRFWSLQSHPTSSNIFSRQLMKIVYLDDDYSKLCDSQTIQERPEFVPKVGGRCMKLSPDGLSMAVGDRHGNIRIFDLEGFRQTAFLEAHDCEVLSVDYSRSSHDATFLASSSRDRFIHVFDVKKDYQLVATLDDHSAAITAVRFTFSSVTSNLQLISCGADKSLIFRSITKNENGKYQFIRSNNIVEKQTFYDLAVDHARESVSTACQDRMIRVYNLQDGKRLRICKGSMSEDTGYLIKMDLDPSGRFLATSCSNKCVYIWDTNSGECLASLCGHGEIVTDLKFSPDGSHLYTISGDSCIFVWNIVETTIESSTVRLPLTLCSTKATEMKITEPEESISQTPNIIEEHQPRQRSLWSTAELRLPPLETKFFRSLLPDVVKDDPCCKLTDSTHSAQYDESVSVDDEEDTTFSTALSHNGTTIEQAHSFFAENYDHDNVLIDTTIHDERQPRKSVSARFRSGSKENAVMENASGSLNSTREESSNGSSIPPSVVPQRSSTKQIRSQVSAPTTTGNSEPRVVPSKGTTNRGMRAGRTRSEDRFRPSSLSLSNPAVDHPTHTHLPSYAAHTSSSMNKLRDHTAASTPSSSSAVPPLSSTTTCVPSSHQTVRTPTNTSTHTRSSSSSRKNMMKSCSTQSLVLHPAVTTNQSNSASKVHPSAAHRTKSTNLARRPPNLPTSNHTAHSTSTSSSSSASSNFSSPTKFLPADEPPAPSSIEPPTVPLRQLDNAPDDLMPKWAQDCFYRTVVLGLKPLLLQDSPSSPMKSMQSALSTCSIESSDSLEINSELQPCPIDPPPSELKVRRSISIPDYRQLKPLSQNSSKESNSDRDEDSIQNDQRIPIIEHLVSNLSQPLDELEQLYATVAQSSDRRDLLVKEYIEEIFTNLHRRLTITYQQQENRTPVAIAD